MSAHQICSECECGPCMCHVREEPTYDRQIAELTDALGLAHGRIDALTRRVEALEKPAEPETCYLCGLSDTILRVPHVSDGIRDGVPKGRRVCCDWLECEARVQRAQAVATPNPTLGCCHCGATHTKLKMRLHRGVCWDHVYCQSRKRAMDRGRTYLRNFRAAPKAKVYDHK